MLERYYRIQHGNKQKMQTMAALSLCPSADGNTDQFRSFPHYNNLLFSRYFALVLLILGIETYFLPFGLAYYIFIQPKSFETFRLSAILS